MSRPGDTVALTLAMVETDDTSPRTRARVSGLFVLEEFWPYEPSNYVHEAGWTIRPVDEECVAALRRFENAREEPVTFWITDAELVEQVDPHAHGRLLELEREMEFAEEVLGESPDPNWMNP